MQVSIRYFDFKEKLRKKEALPKVPKVSKVPNVALPKVPLQ